MLSGYSLPYPAARSRTASTRRPGAVVLTVATAVAMPEEFIWFGVLHLLGCAALLTCLLHPALEKLPPLAGLRRGVVWFC